MIPVDDMKAGMRIKELVEGGIYLPEIRDGENSIDVWRARFTLEHYQDKGFRSGLLEQHDEHGLRHSVELDYTPETLEEVLDWFCAWLDSYFDTERVTVDGKTVWTFEK